MRRHRFLLCLILALILSGISAAPAPPLDEPVESPAAVESGEEIDQCLACHSDKDTLINTAKAEEAVESENEGEG